MPNKKRLIPCRDWLIYWRICRKTSIKTIAELAGCSESTVSVRLRDYNVPEIKRYGVLRTSGHWERELRKPRVRASKGVTMETAIPEPGRRQVMNLFLQHLSHAWKLSKKTNKKPSVAAFVTQYRKILHGRHSAVKARR